MTEDGKRVFEPCNYPDCVLVERTEHMRVTFVRGGPVKLQGEIIGMWAVLPLDQPHDVVWAAPLGYRLNGTMTCRATLRFWDSSCGAPADGLPIDAP